MTKADLVEQVHEAIGPGVTKKDCAAVIDALVAPVREGRAQWVSRRDDIEDILRAGNARACEETEKTLEAVRSAMGLR